MPFLKINQSLLNKNWRMTDTIQTLTLSNWENTSKLIFFFFAMLIHKLILLIKKLMYKIAPNWLIITNK